METKVDKGKMLGVARSLGFNGVEVISAKGLAGGFCLLWNKDINISIMEASNNCFEALSLALKTSCCYEPWLVIGDLNCILNDEEKMGGKKIMRPYYLILICSKGEDSFPLGSLRLGQKKALVVRKFLRFGRRVSKRMQEFYSETLITLEERYKCGRRKKWEIWMRSYALWKSIFNGFKSRKSRKNSVWRNKGRVKDRVRELAKIMNGYFIDLFSSSNPDIPCDLEDLARWASRLFFQEVLDMVGDNVCATVQEAFRSGEIHPRLNYTFICLIPKVNNPRRMEQFQPIRFRNFPYKVITKILSNRLRSYMEALISPLQSAFIPGRWIGESSILTQELVHKIRKKKGVGGLMAIKLDMLKAYDKMEWPFILRVLKANGFEDKICNIIMSGITGVSYSVLFNGSPLKKFKPQRGLRQGDPLSPYIFLLCQEVLSKIILSQQNRGKIHGIRIARNAIPISHLMFADDTILFARANSEEATNLMGCLNLYEKWSGQVCSRAKSSVLFSNNLASDKRKDILQKLTIKQSDGEERHLGNPFVFKRRKRESFLKLRESMLQKLEGWRMRLLSYAERLTLIKSVASAMPIYAMSTNRVPISICRELDALLRRYWWQGQVTKGRFMALKAWDSICQPKSSGGLGIRRFEDANRALMAKLTWSIAEGSNKPWIVCLLGKYCKNENFWTVKKKNSDSYLWKCILEVRNIILKGSLAIPAGGESIDIWNQPWIPWLEFNDFKSLMGSLRARGFTARTVADVSMGKHDGSFSVKGAYLVDQNLRFQDQQPVWNWVWHSDLHPRIAILLWRVLSNAIPVKDRLPFLEDKECVLCSSYQESCLHLFRDCSLTKSIWFLGNFPLRVEHIPGINMVDFVKNLVLEVKAAGVGRKEILTYLGCVMDQIWMTRNNVCRLGEVVKIDEISRRVGKAFEEYSRFSNGDDSEITPCFVNRSLGCQMVSMDVDWMVFTDASWLRGEAGIAVMVSRLTGRWSSKSVFTKAISAFDAELSAILMALKWAIEEKKQQIQLFSDCQTAIQAFAVNQCPKDWRSLNKSLSILDISSRFNLCKFHYISRDVNLSADSLAKSARISRQSACLVQGEGDPPVIPNFLFY
uniref:Reverse transcriptase domain-containing protein n=1 Tax=Cannabis sativa TaxID=3483 RepID=A0A803PUX2_CANSA